MAVLKAMEIYIIALIHLTITYLLSSNYLAIKFCSCSLLSFGRDLINARLNFCKNDVEKTC